MPTGDATPSLHPPPSAAGRGGAGGSGRLRRNVVANLVGNGVTAVTQLAFIPLYVKFLGVEAYGLVGVYATVQALSSILDVAISTTVNRELARLSGVPGAQQEERDIVRTLEVVYWALGLVAAAVLAALAPLIAERWINAEGLAPGVVSEAIALMALVVGLQCPAGFYAGGLQGLQRQVTTNVISSGAAVLRGVGAVAILALVSPTLRAFFLWQSAVAALQTAAAAVALWRALPAAGAPRFRAAELRRVATFAASMTGISVLSLALIQTDKVVLSRLLPLREFGYYTLAGALGLGLYRVIAPVSTAMFPHLSQLVRAGDEPELVRAYHRGAQLLSVVVLPAAVVAALFAREVLLLWTRNPALVEPTAPLLALLVVGTALNGMVTMPYLLQLAYGRTRLTLIANGTAVIVVIPLLYVACRRFGAVGAAASWSSLNTFYVLVVVRLMRREMLPRELGAWYARDLGRPLLAAVVVAGACRLLLPHAEGATGAVRLAAELALVGTATLAAAAASVDWIRARGLAVLARVRPVRA